MKTPRILLGTLGILSSRTGVMSLFALVVASVLCNGGHVDGTAYAAIVATISTIFTWTRARPVQGTQ